MSSSKANGKAKASPGRAARPTSTATTSFGLSPNRLYDDQLRASPMREWPEVWSQMEGVSGSRSRLSADCWESVGASKWTHQRRCE